jgi:hypothetical protein
MRRGGQFNLLGFLLLSHLLYLLALIFNLLLLLLQLALRLLILHLTVLQLVAYQVSAACAEGATDCRSCARVTHRSADYCTSAGAQQSAYAGTFFALTERLSRTSRNEQGCRERQCRRS